MFPLIETVIAFSVIMLTLSFLVKSLASVIKNHVSYYSKHFSAYLEAEAYRFLRGTLKKVGVVADRTAVDELSKISWEKLSEKFLSEENMRWWLKKLGMDPDNNKQHEKEIESIEARLVIHKANILHAYAKRTNNLALAAGLGLCLFMNINALTIWDTLYNNSEVRAKFSSPESVQAAMELAEKKKEQAESLVEPEPPAAGEEGIAGPPESLEQQREKLRAEREELLEQIAHFRGEVSFGVGRVWTETPAEDHAWRFLGFEFLGSLLTGILVSIGAPYWHDLLSALAGLGGKKAS